MYDFICIPQIMRDILGDYSNFALRKKRFSMQNLYEIKSGAIMPILEKIIQDTQLHINDCEVIKIYFYSIFKNIIYIGVL
jgi:hypothetical protein